MEEPRILNRISVSDENLLALSQRYKASRCAVYNALAYRSNSDKAKKIRSTAISELNGRISTIQVF